ncbi:MAG: N-acetylglucosamine-6-phosphate deacetylase [Actinomycetota bacterium]
MSADLVLRGGSVVTPSGRVDADVTIEGGRILAVGTAGPAEATIDATGLIVAPGFIDLQVNGGWGADITSEPATMWPLAERLVAHGVTSFLPTVVTSPPAAVGAARGALRGRPTEFTGAEPLGLHLEGPFIAPAKRGAHAAEHIVAPDLAIAESWTRRDGVAMVTLAPELPGAGAVIEQLRADGVVVAGGHSEATAAQASAAIDAGLTHLTHLFNAMAPLAHREPGIVGVGLARSDLTVGLIVDGLHLHPVTVEAVWRAKGPHGVVLVSDSASAMGRPHGEHRLGDRRVIIDETGIRTRDGTLAGSAITLDIAVRNLVTFTGCSPDEAITAASTTPARVIGATSKGEIAPGRDADLTLLSADLGVVATIVGGAIAWSA